jgi:hypothetical protein
MVEENNLWELLWYGDVPKKERASQLLFSAVAEGLCRVNDIDISPEPNMGGGPVDFKLSKGHSARVLVEMKMSTGTVVSGYSKQLEIYKNAANTKKAYFVVIDVGGLGKKVDIIRQKRTEMIKSGNDASEIVVINAKKRASASKIR